MEPCEFIIISGTNVPGVTGINTSYLNLADRSRTLSGALRQDTLIQKREWRVPLTLTGIERQAVITLVNTNLSSRVVTIDGVGAVTAFVSITNDRRVRRPSAVFPHEWDYLGGTLELLIEEA